MLSAAEREELVKRVSRRVTHPAADLALVRSAVDRVADALGTREARDAAVVVSAESMPDLASRLRAAVAPADIGDLGVATEGRHTVVVARVASAQVEAVRDAATRIGARVVSRDLA